MRNPQLQALQRYLCEKYDMGLLEDFVVHQSAKYFVVILGAQSKIWNKVLEPEIHRMVDVYKTEITVTALLGTKRKVWFHVD